MKRILFLFATLVLLCIFSLSVGAVTGARSDEFGEVTYVSGVNENTDFEDLPKDWVCPLCGAGKEDFTEEIQEDDEEENAL